MLWFSACVTTPKIQENQTDFSLKSATLTASEQNTLQNGDILLRRGYGFVSDYIVATLNEPLALTHCGIVERTSDVCKIISSESDELQGIDGVQSTSLSVFLRDAQPNSIVAVRLKNTTAAEQNALVQTAKYYEKRKKAFDYGFNAQDSSKFYCAEFLKIVIKNTLKKDILDETIQKNTIKLLTMQQFYDTTKFEIVFKQ